MIPPGNFKTSKKYDFPNNGDTWRPVCAITRYSKDSRIKLCSAGDIEECLDIGSIANTTCVSLDPLCPVELSRDKIVT